NASAWVLGIVGEAKAGMNRGRRDVDTNAKPGQAAAPLHPACQARGVGQANPLLRPTEDKSSWLQDESCGSEEPHGAVLAQQRHHIETWAGGVDHDGRGRFLLVGKPDGDLLVEGEIDRG